jgi:hypothetical protein
MDYSEQNDADVTCTPFVRWKRIPSITFVLSMDGSHLPTINPAGKCI